MAKKCIKSALFCFGVRVGRPKSLRPPARTLTSSKTGPSISRIAATLSRTSSGVIAVKAYETKISYSFLVSTLFLENTMIFS